MPSADFYRWIRRNYFLLSHDSVTNDRSPEVSLTAFSAQPPDLPPVPLMDVSFAVICLLARHRRPHIRFLSIGSHLCSTLLSDIASRQYPCASLSLHLHQVVKRTFTSKLSNMLGTQTKAAGVSPAAPHNKFGFSCDAGRGGSPACRLECRDYLCCDRHDHGSDRVGRG